MKYKLKFITKAAEDFQKLKRDGFGGIIFSPAAVTLENLKTAGNYRLKKFVHITELEKIKCEYLENDEVIEGEILSVTAACVKKTVKKLGGLISEIDGFSIPIPLIRGLLWDNSFPTEYKNFCGENLYEKLTVLFDADTEYSETRIWYYKRAAEKLFSEYVLPSYNAVLASGKAVCFEIGNNERGDFAIGKLILPSLFEKAGIPLICEKNGEPYFVKPDKNAKTLFVAATRYIMGMYVWNGEYSKEESRFTLALWEEAYYRNSFEKIGIKARFIDDFTFLDMRITTLKRFENIVFARDCMIEKSKKEKLLSSGVRIDDAELLKRLDAAN